MTIGHLVGMVIMFALFMVPSTLFVNLLIGKTLHMGLRSRVALSVVVAGVAAVFFVLGAGIGPNQDYCDDPRYCSR